jgi:hypothetical protein
MLKEEIKEYLKTRLEAIYEEAENNPSAQLMGMVEGSSPQAEAALTPLIDTLQSRFNQLSREATEIRRLLKELDS